MSSMILVRTPEELLDAIKLKPACFFIALNYGARSTKHITYKPRRKLFAVLNEIDGTRQTLTCTQLMDPAHSNIGPAMRAGAFYAEVA